MQGFSPSPNQDEDLSRAFFEMTPEELADFIDGSEEQFAAALKVHEYCARRLRFLAQQEKAAKDEASGFKAKLEVLYSRGLVPAKGEYFMQYSDGETRRVTLCREPSGNYFKVSSEWKKDFDREKSELEQSFLDEGRAHMAPKAPAWKTREAKTF